MRCNAAESLDPWEHSNGVVYTCIAACCYLARTRYLRTSKWLLLLAGHFGVAAVTGVSAPPLVAAGDVDGDGRIDIVAGGAGSPTITMALLK